MLLPLFLGILFFLVIPQIILYRNVFFLQNRPGKSGKIFVLIKFQTMRSGHEQDEKRLTLLGGFLRKTALDELPQVLNILKGDMSFVGPRPLLPEYLPLYNRRHVRRHEVKPGITGLAQVSGADIKTWQEKLDTDVAYVENMSLQMDMKIIFKTILLLLTKAGRNKEFINTKFTGYEA